MATTTSVPGDALRLLKEVVRIPTAPFCEEMVQEFVFFVAQENGLQARSDRFGNIRVDYMPSRKKKKKAKAGEDPAGDADPLPTVCFTAHMDHPGFIVQEYDATTRAGIAEFRGWIPRESMKDAELRIYDEGVLVKATALEALPETERGTFPRFRFKVPKGDLREEPGQLGTFDVPFCTVRGDRLHTKSADDLAQVGILLAWLVGLKKSKTPCHGIGLFTRAEEVGFVGASALLETGLMPGPETPVVVLECSKQIRGQAEVGKGPVIRVGDAGTVYDRDVDAWMWRTARAMQKEDDEAAAGSESAKAKSRRLQVQRALMTGGVCEAGLFTVIRDRIGAIALPMLNYHNINDSGRPAPEIVSLSDCANQLRLMTRLATEPFVTLKDGPLRESVRGMYEQLSQHLEDNRYAKRHTKKVPRKPTIG